MNRFLIQNIIFTKNYYYIVLKGLLKVLKIFEILGILFDFFLLSQHMLIEHLCMPQFFIVPEHC